MVFVQHLEKHEDAMDYAGVCLIDSHLHFLVTAESVLGVAPSGGG